MGGRTSYAPGTFSWVDLATTDAVAAKAFSSGLFGWELQDAGGGGVSTTCSLDGDAVCGLFETAQGPQAAGGSASWTSYVTVEDADAAAARAGEVGGEVLIDAFDVLDAGRTAMLRDPQGAAFAVWQPGARVGTERVDDVGCLRMNELATSDVGTSTSFYERLFGWTTEVSDTAPEGPWMILNRGSINGAVFPAPPGTPSSWRPCFTVGSTEQAVERVRELGGQLLVEPVDIGHGSIAVVRDPLGAVLTVFAGETDG